MPRNSRNAERAKSRHTKMRILQEFDSKKEILTRYADYLKKLIDDILPDKKRVHSVTTRVKSRARLEHKLVRKGYKYRALDDITDCVGVRVITYFHDDIDRVSKVIHEHFLIDENESVDKRKDLAFDEFGYKSLHLISSLNEARASLAENANFKGLRFELQVRSILQHAWAEIEHDRYEQDFPLPSTIARKYARLASLLEIAEEEFADIREQSDTYGTLVSETAWSKLNDDARIDKMLVGALIEGDPCKALDKRLSVAIRRSIHSAPSHADEFHDYLDRSGLGTVGDIRTALTTYDALLTPFVKGLVRLWSEDYEAEDSCCAGECLKFLSLLHVLNSNSQDRVAGFLRAVARADNPVADAKRLQKMFCALKPASSSRSLPSQVPS